MDTRRASQESAPAVKWPLVGSLVLTAIVVAMVCVPPVSGLRNPAQLVALACVYMLAAACVHALAVWSIYRIQSEGVRDWALVWPVVWGAWMAVVWLPLVALLTYERSSWVVVILPVAGASLALFVVSRRCDDDDESVDVVRGAVWPEMFSVDDTPRLWRVLLPSLVAAVLIDAGAALYAANHAWMAGALLAFAAAYFAERIVSRTAALVKVREDTVGRTSAGNSVAVWILTVVALLPFLAGVGLAIRGVLGMPAVRAANYVPNFAHSPSRDWAGIVLTRPKMRHQIVMPVLTMNPESFSKSKVIPFDGQYWYFQPPESGPGPKAHVMPGDPTKSRIRSTNHLAVMMEAHQRFAIATEVGCCRALQLNVVNADAVPGVVRVEALLRDELGHVVSLGTKTLASSAVSPMPLKRAPVHETLTFEIPRAAKGRRFDEMTVKVKPEMERALAAPELGIESFAFQR